MWTSNSGDFVSSADHAGAGSVVATETDQVPRRQYTVVLDLNGVLVHRVFHRNNPTVQRRPGLKEFLNWLFERARVIFWSSAAERNMRPLLRTILSCTSVSYGEVTYFSQAECTFSSYKNPSQPNKPYFLKDLGTLHRMDEIDSVDNALMIDDSPVKNLLNDPYNAVHPETWSGDTSDIFLGTCLRPWLDGLFESNEAVPVYVKAVPLLGCQLPEERLGRLAKNVLQCIADSD